MLKLSISGVGKYWMTAANAENPVLIKAPLADVMQYLPKAEVYSG